MQESKTGVRVAIIMGSKSDLATMENAATPLTELGVEFELKIVSAHRTPACHRCAGVESAAQRLR